MREFSYILPIGSVVLLEGGNTPMLIVGVYKTVQPNVNSRALFFDYAATTYPDGMNENPMYYFNHENISQIIFRGMESKDFFKFLQIKSQQAQNALAQNIFVRGKIN